MKVDVYDFDKTIYDGDSSVDFYLFCLKRKPLIIIYLPMQVGAIILYKLKMLTKERMKECFFAFFRLMKGIDNLVIDFWNVNDKKLKSWYLKQNHSQDVIISASPEFLLKPCCDKLKVKKLIATKVDKLTGRFNSKNCYGQEKVKRFNEEMPDAIISSMYSDSYSDRPLLELANEGFIVKKDVISKYRM